MKLYVNYIALADKLTSESRTKAWSKKIHNQNEYENSVKKIYIISPHSVMNIRGKHVCFFSVVVQKPKKKWRLHLKGRSLHIVHIPCTNEMSMGYSKTKLHHHIIVHFLVLMLHSVGHLLYVLIQNTAEQAGCY